LLKVRARVPNAHPRDTEHVVALCNEVIREGNGTLVFCSSKRGCQSTAKMISEVGVPLPTECG
jgi:DNA polymerase theta